MINYQYKDLFLENSIPKQVKISTGSAVLNNDDLYNQEMTLEESLCSEEELRFGCCEASIFKFKISDIFSPMINKQLDVSMVLDNHSDNPFAIGRYKVDSDKLAADRRYREIIAYDEMHDIINADVAAWYNSVLPEKGSTMTLKQFRGSFVSHFNLSEIVPVGGLANDSMTVERTIEPDKLSGMEVITRICEINGCFGHIGRDGKFHYIYLTQDMMGVYPGNNLFPNRAPDYLPQAKTGRLYPQSPKSTRITKNDYISGNSENFVTKTIDRLQIRQSENDIGAIFPKGNISPDDNCYIIQDNFLVYGKSADELDVIAENIYEKIHKIVYMPFNCEAIGNPCLEVGDAVRFSTRFEIVESYILQRTLKGIQALRDAIKASGKERYQEKVNGVQNSIMQLKGKTNTLEKDVEHTKETITDLDKNLRTEIEQTSKSFRISVITGDDGKSAELKLFLDEEDGTHYEVTAGKIEFKGLVSFKNLTNSGETLIDGGNIKADSIDAEKLIIDTLYVLDKLRIKHMKPDGTFTMRTALYMKDVEGQTMPNLVLGGDGKFANIETVNDVFFYGVNGIECSKLFVNGQSQFGKMITMSGSDFYFDKAGTKRGIKVIDDNGQENFIAALDNDDLTTLIGCISNSEKATTTKLRGNSVVLGSGATVTSDERLKNSFKPLDEFDEVYMDINPCAFKYNNGTSGRYHFGAKAQDVKKAFEKHGFTTKDFGGIVQMTDNPESDDYCGVDDPMGLIYAEFTMWNMHMVQNLYKENEELKERLSMLEERMEKYEQSIS